MEYAQIARTLYDSTQAGDNLAASGNSKTIRMHPVQDLVLSVTNGTPGGTSPQLQVQIDMQDTCGNWITQVIKTAQITAAGTVVVYGGLHTSQVVLTGLIRVAWTITGAGATFPGLQISLIGR